MKTRTFVCGAVLGAALWATSAFAQSTAPQSGGEQWEFQFVPYLWGSSFDGEFGIGNRTADVDASFANILKHLHFAAMGMGDARRGKLVLLADALYTDVRGQRATPGPLFSSVSPQQKLFFVTPEAGYRVRETENSSLDVVGGIRLWHLNSELQFQAGVLPSLDLEASRTWVDAVAGVRARRDLRNNWWVGGYGDLGGGRSDFTFQLVATAGVDLRSHYALVFGYRYLSVDFDRDNFLMDTALQGPLFGFTFKF